MCERIGHEYAGEYAANLSRNSFRFKGGRLDIKTKMGCKLDIRKTLGCKLDICR